MPFKCKHKIRGQRGQRGVKISSLIFSDGARSFPEKKTTLYMHGCTYMCAYVPTFEYEIYAFLLSVENILFSPF